MTVDAARAKSIFLAASELPNLAERADYLVQECGSDGPLRARVEALLRADDAAADLGDEPSGRRFEATIDAPAVIRPGTLVAGGRSGLDCDEGFKQRTQPALRDGQRPGAGRGAIPARRGGGGLPTDHPNTLFSMNNLASCCWSLKQVDQSVSLFEELLPLQEKILGCTHPDTQMMLVNRGVNYKDSGPRKEAILHEIPQRIGRFRIDKVLSNGGLGFVFAAQDEQQKRLVAVKVPHAKPISQTADAYPDGVAYVR